MGLSIVVLLGGVDCLIKNGNQIKSIKSASETLNMFILLIYL